MIQTTSLHHGEACFLDDNETLRVSYIIQYMNKLCKYIVLSTTYHLTNFKFNEGNLDVLFCSTNGRYGY